MTNHNPQTPDPAAFERHHCPHCGRTSRHHVTRDRVPAPVLWCLSCFHVHIEGGDAGDQASGGVGRLTGNQGASLSNHYKKIIRPPRCGNPGSGKIHPMSF